ncbi:MAG: DUF2493 domain-containing protein [Pseudonocardiaceae bacterium]
MARRADPVRILVTGSRTWDDKDTIDSAITGYLRSISTSTEGDPPCPVVVHGGARGADQLADRVARERGWTPECHRADWDRYGRSAGYRRNAVMVTLGANVCLAFIHQHSPGATHAAELAQRAGIPTHRYHR